MKKLLIALAFLTFLFTITIPAASQKRTTSKSSTYKPKTVRVKSYTKKNGTRVKSHYRSKPTKRKHSYFKLPAILTKEMAA